MIPIENIIAAIAAFSFVFFGGYFVLRSIVVGVLEIPRHLFDAAFGGGAGCGTVVVFVLGACISKALGWW